MSVLNICRVNAIRGHLLKLRKQWMNRLKSVSDRAATPPIAQLDDHYPLFALLSRTLVIVLIATTCMSVVAQQPPPMKDWWVHKFMVSFQWTDLNDVWSGQLERSEPSFSSAQDACADRLELAQNPPGGACTYANYHNYLSTRGMLDADGYPEPVEHFESVCTPNLAYTTATANAGASTCTIFDKDISTNPNNPIRIIETEPIYKIQCPVSMHYKSYKYSQQLYPGCICDSGKEWNTTVNSCVEVCVPPKSYDAGTNSCMCPEGQAPSPTNPAVCIPKDNLPQTCGMGTCPPDNNPTNQPDAPNPQGGSGSSGCLDAGSNPPVGNPIYPLTGVKVEPVSTGISIGGVDFSLTYDTSARAPGSVSSLFAQLPSFGGIWFSSLHRKLTVSATGKTALLARGGGRIASLSGDGLGAFTTVDNLNAKLVATTDGYRYQDDAGLAQELYNNRGLLTSITTAAGRVLTFTYNSNDNLVAVRDETGKAIQFEYAAVITDSPLQLVSRIIDPTGLAIVPRYDASNGNLSRLTWQDGKTRQFLYENSDFPWALTGVIDENGSLYSQFVYDNEGRAVWTEHSGEVDRFTVNYGKGPSISVVESRDTSTNALTRTRRWVMPSEVVLTTPNGKSVNMGAQNRLGMPALTSRSQPAGSGCLASISSRVYETNANANLVSKDDFNGKRSCYAYDLTRNVATSVVEGLENIVDCSSVLGANATLPLGSRKLSTQFHPDWNLTKKSARPLGIVTRVYNGQLDPFNGTAANCAPPGARTPDDKPIAVLCKQVVQATSDTNGSQGLAATLVSGIAPRVASYTYDVAGRVLTATDSSNHTTSYVYAMTPMIGEGPDAMAIRVGDLLSITGPTGLVTSFNSYDKAGRVLRMTDAKGIVTNISYTPRGWVNTVTVTPPGGAPRTTTYGYDDVGQLTGVSNPDGTTLGFTYDDAHRLIGATDARGNTVTYKLDQAGNRVFERVSDPSGTLLRSVQRTFDDLNRNQQLQKQDVSSFPNS